MGVGLLGVTTKKLEFFFVSTSPIPASKKPVTVSCGPASSCVRLHCYEISKYERRNFHHLVSDHADERVSLLRHSNLVPHRTNPAFFSENYWSIIDLEGGVGQRVATWRRRASASASQAARSAAWARAPAAAASSARLCASAACRSRLVPGPLALLPCRLGR